MGRHKIPESLKRRSVSFTMNSEELAMLEFICKYNGMTTSGYIRHLIAKEYRFVEQHKKDRMDETAKILQSTSNQMHSAIGLDVS